MRIKVFNNKKSVYIGKKVINSEATLEDNDKVKNDIYHYLDEGYDVRIEKNGEYIMPDEYYDQEDETEEVVEEVDEDNNSIPYDELFTGHWATQAKNVEEYTDDPETVEEILEYARENNISDGTINKIEDYLTELGE